MKALQSSYNINSHVAPDGACDIDLIGFYKHFAPTELWQTEARFVFNNSSLSFGVVERAACSFGTLIKARKQAGSMLY